MKTLVIEMISELNNGYCEDPLSFNSQLEFETIKVYLVKVYYVRELFFRVNRRPIWVNVLTITIFQFSSIKLFCFI